MAQAPLPASEYRTRLDLESLEVNASERERASFLVIEKDDSAGTVLKNSLLAAGFENVSVFTSFHQALAQLSERSFSHILFSSETTDKLSVTDFIDGAMSREKDAFFVVISSNPEREQVFDLLKRGVRGFLIRPYSTEQLEQVLNSATKGEPLSQAILNAPDRNKAFAALVSKALDRLAEAKRVDMANSSPSAGEYERAQAAFRDVTAAAKTFAENGVDSLLESFLDFFTKLASGPATELGRLRERLKRRRQK